VTSGNIKVFGPEDMVHNGFRRGDVISVHHKALYISSSLVHMRLSVVRGTAVAAESQKGYVEAIDRLILCLPSSVISSAEPSERSGLGSSPVNKLRGCVYRSVRGEVIEVVV
jgi:hypothetical protein